MEKSAALTIKKAEEAYLERKSDRDVEEAESEPESQDTFSYSPVNTNIKNAKFTLKGKKKLPIIIVFIALALSVVLILVNGTSLLPGHFNANTIEATDVMYTAMEATSEAVTSELLATGSLPSGFADRLTSSGLEVGYLDSSNNFIAGLRPSSDTHIALASAGDSSNTSADNSLVLRFKNNIITFADIQDYFDTDPEFYAAFREATYGRAVNHFDTAASDFYANIVSSTRNTFKNYQDSGNITDDTEAFNEAFAKIFSSPASTANTVVDITYNFENEVHNAYGDQDMVYGCYYSGSKEKYPGYEHTSCPRDCVIDETTGEETCHIREGTEEFLTEEEMARKYESIYDTSVSKGSDGRYYANVLSTSASAATGASSYIDSLSEMGYSTHSSLDTEYKNASILSQAVNANETYNAMSYYLTIEEAISKMMAGLGYASPINPVLNALTEEVTTLDASGNTVTGSALQSPVLSSMLTKSFDSSLKRDGSSSSVDRGIEHAVAAIIELTGNEVASTTSNAEVTSILDAMDNSMSNTKVNSGSFITDFGCYFIGKIEDIKAKATGSVIASITPSISQSVLFGKASDLEGIASGDFLALGASALGAKIASFTSGGTIGTSSAIAAYQKETDRVLALDAAADRVTHSPFDTSNQNTFLGSIASSMTSSLIKDSNLLSTFSSLKSLTSSSLASLFPGVHASGDDSSFQTTYGENCTVNKFSAEATVQCIPIVTFDVSTLRSALGDKDFEDFLDDNTEADSDGSRVPKENSDFSYFLAYNNGRQSNAGSKNNNIYNTMISGGEATSIRPKAGDGSFLERISSFFSGLKTKLKNVIEKLVSLFTSSSSPSGNTNVINEIDVNGKYNEDQLDRIERISTGEEFMNGGEYWDVYRFAQAKVAIDRFLDQVEYYSKENTNQTALSAYFIPATGQNPTASYIASITEVPESETEAEYLSRISGLTVAESEYALNLVTVETYLANFDYDALLHPGETETERKVAVLPKIPHFTEKSPKNTPVIAENHHIYTEKRRNYAFSA